MRQFLFVVLLIFNSQFSFGQSEIWARSSGGQSDEEAEDLVLDGEGNIYVAGFFKSSVLKFGNITLKNSGGENSDVFIAKYDPSGKLLWAHSGGGLGEEEPMGLSVDKSGNVIMRGYFESEIFRFDDKEIKNNNTGDISMFIVKYSPDGKVLWTKASEVLGNAQWIDNAGNIIVAGEVFKDVKVHFDNIVFETPEKGTFIVKYSPEGNVLWAKKGEGGLAYNVSGDVSGNVYVSGIVNEKAFHFDGKVHLANVGPDKTTDAFIMKLYHDGTLIWNDIVAGQGEEEPRAQYVNKNGQIYIVCRYTSIKLKIGNATYKNGGGDDLLLLKYDSDGKVLWSKSAGGSAHDNPIYLIEDKNDNMILAGHFYSSKISFDNISLSNVGLNDIFIVKYNPEGKVLWAKTTGGDQHDYPNGLISDVEGNVYLIGEFNSSPNKDKITSEFFMEKYDPFGKVVWKSEQHRSEVFDFAFGESIDKNDNLYVVGYYEGNIKFGGSNFKSGGNKDIFILKYNVRK